MSAFAFQTFADKAHGAVATRMLLAGGAYDDQSWTVLSLLVMTGNFFFDLTAS